jgi:hypothetical protein
MPEQEIAPVAVFGTLFCPSLYLKESFSYHGIFSWNLFGMAGNTPYRFLALLGPNWRGPLLLQRQLQTAQRYEHISVYKKMELFISRKQKAIPGSTRNSLPPALRYVRR